LPHRGYSRIGPPRSLLRYGDDFKIKTGDETILLIVNNHKASLNRVSYILSTLHVARTTPKAGSPITTYNPPRKRRSIGTMSMKNERNSSRCSFSSSMSLSHQLIYLNRSAGDSSQALHFLPVALPTINITRRKKKRLKKLSSGSISDCKGSDFGIRNINNKLKPPKKTSTGMIATKNARNSSRYVAFACYAWVYALI